MLAYISRRVLLCTVKAVRVARLTLRSPRALAIAAVFWASWVGAVILSSQHARSLQLIGQSDNQYFGDAMAAVGDVNCDGFNDLAIVDDSASSLEQLVYLYYGPVSAVTTPDLTWSVVANGYAILGPAGDVNGDGCGDLLLSLPYADSDMYSGSGIVHVYYGQVDGLKLEQSTQLTGKASDDYFGETSIGIGDINGDGYSDIYVNANSYVDVRGEVYLGGAAGLATTPTGVYRDPGAYSLGAVAVAAGDLNGDGLDDFALGDGSANGFGGRAILFYGSYADWNTAAPIILNGTNPQKIGESLAAGDFNGDGYSDLAVAESGYNGNRGRFRLYWGGGALINLHSPSAYVDNPYIVDGSYLFGRTGHGADWNGDDLADLAGVAPSAQRLTLHSGSQLGVVAAPNFVTTGGESDFANGLASGDMDGDGFGDLLIRDHTFDVDLSNLNRGRVLLLYGGADNVTSAAGRIAAGGSYNNQFGTSLAYIGDVNGDGLGDLAVGEPGDNGNNNLGRVRIFYGFVGDGGMAADTDILGFDDLSDHGAVGSHIGAAGDVNGDGYSDVLVTELDNGALPGAVYLHLGSAAGLQTQATQTFVNTGGSTYEDYGLPARGIGDINGDGFSDIAIATPEVDPSWVAIYWGAAAGLPTMPSQVLPSPRVDTGFGVDLAPLGDVNGDGLADLAIVDIDQVHVYLGDVTGFNANPDLTIDADSVEAIAGGDVNGDSYGDLIVGRNAGPCLGCGIVELWLGGQVNVGGALGMAEVSVVLGEGASGDGYGRNVESDGDVDGDGIDDIVISSAAGGVAGRIEVILGAKTMADGVQVWQRRSFDEAGVSYFGDLHALALADFTGDGYADVVAADEKWDTFRGLLNVYLGNQGAVKRSAYARALSADTVTPLAPGGRLSPVGHRSFAVWAKAASPLGANSYALEVEVKSVTQPFDGKGLWRSDYANFAPPALPEFNLAVTALAPGWVKWRARLVQNPVRGAYTGRWLRPLRQAGALGDVFISNTPPTLSAVAAPAAVPEGQTATRGLSLHVYDPDGDQLTLRADCNGDNDYGDSVDALKASLTNGSTSINCHIQADNLDGPTQKPITLQLSDAYGAAATLAISVPISNIAPGVSVAIDGGPYSAASQIACTVVVSDVAADLPATLTYEWLVNGQVSAQSGASFSGGVPGDQVACRAAASDKDGGASAAVQSNLVTLLTDRDGDGLPDIYELEHGLDPDNAGDAADDNDGDGLSNLQEGAAGTDPNNADSDGDGAADGLELANGFDPLDASDGAADNDGDGVSNADELLNGSDPDQADQADVSNVIAGGGCSAAQGGQSFDAAWLLLGLLALWRRCKGPLDGAK